MNTDFVQLLDAVWLHRPRVDMNALEEAWRKIRSDIKQNQLKRPKTTKQFATVALAETMTQEARILKDFNGLQKTVKVIVDKAHRRKNDKKGIVNDAEKKELDTLQAQSEYYGEVLNHIGDCKFVLVEFLAAQNPKAVASSPRKLKLVRECLPAWNVVRRLVESSTKGNGQQQYQYSVKEYAAALILRGITINKKGRDVNSPANYTNIFSISGQTSLYKKWNEFGQDEQLPQHVEARAKEIISVYKL